MRTAPIARARLWAITGIDRIATRDGRIVWWDAPAFAPRHPKPFVQQPQSAVSPRNR